VAEIPVRIPAVILAGQSVSRDDLLAAYTQGNPKALLPLLGRPMVAYVIDALAGSRYVPRIVVVGLQGFPEESFPVPVDFLPDAHDILTNAEAGLSHAAAASPGARGVLLSSSDVPLVTSSIVDSLIAEFLRTDHDLYYSAIERSVMEARFPASGRSYVHLREGAFAGGDISMLHPSLIVQNRALWQRLSEARKSALKQARLIGLWPAILLLTRRLTLADAERRVSKALNLRGRVVPCPFAEVGMDVDKPFQLELVRATLQARAEAARQLHTPERGET
jgi:molybdopterin-guanine dinucleotide biosynthesis protein A